MVNISNQVIPNRGLAPQAKASDVQILAAIDIGTNSVHMVVVKIEPSLPAFTIIAREKDTVRLGDRDRKTGKLTLAAMERAIAALKRCHDLAISLHADQIIAVATSATREAANGDEFLALIEKEVGISVNLISGQEEARRIYLGVVSGMDFQNQAHIIIDIGGGSTELILADSQEIRFLSSTKIGAVRLSQDFITTDPISTTELAYLRAEKLGEIPNPLNGYQLTRKDVKELVKRFAALDYNQRLAILGMSDKRAEIILAGSIVLLEAMTMLDVDKLVLCERALREGVIVDWMLTHGLIDNRLLYQSEIRQRSVLKIAKKYQVNLESAERIAAFSLSLFEQTQAQLHSWNQEAKDLLWAAAILHNSGLYVSHAAHHKHSYYLIRNGELLGYTEIELEVIANIARYHRKSKPKKRHDDFMKLTEYYQYMVRHLSAILRLAVALDRRQIGAIKKIECKYDPEYRTLHLHLFPNNAEDDCALELWSLDYKKPVFEEEFGVKVVATLAFLPLNHER